MTDHATQVEAQVRTISKTNGCSCVSRQFRLLKKAFLTSESLPPLFSERGTSVSYFRDKVALLSKQFSDNSPWTRFETEVSYMVMCGTFAKLQFLLILERQTSFSNTVLPFIFKSISYIYIFRWQVYATKFVRQMVH